MERHALERADLFPLLDELDRAVNSEFQSIACVVGHIAKVDQLGAYRLRGFDTMHAYCVEWCHLSEDGAYRRIQAARKAREFPILFDELAAGRLNLSAVCLLAPHLTRENVGEFVEAARHRTNAQIKEWLTEKLFVRSTVPTPVARQIEVPLPRPAPSTTGPLVRPSEAFIAVEPEVPVMPTPAPDTRPLEYEMRFTIGRADHERYRYAQALLSHAIPSGDMAAIFRRAIEAVIAECEKRKLGATRPSAEAAREADEAPPANHRHIPAHVRRAVWRRDGGRCTKVLPSGHRCPERRFLEFDHVVPLARGGKSTVENVRIRCRAHNQEEADHALGAAFMKGRRRRAAIARSVGQALNAAAGAKTVRHGP